MIIGEFLSRNTYGKARQFQTRQTAAIKALYESQESIRKAEEKRWKKKKEKVKPKEKVQRGRAICQLDDNGSIIAEYESLSQLVEICRSQFKDIRDVGHSDQKQAGRFCWKYKD